MAKKRTNAEITAEIAIRKERNDKIVAAARAIAEAEDIAKQEAVDQIDIVPEALGRIDTARVDATTEEDIAKQEAVDQIDIVPEALEVSVAEDMTIAGVVDQIDIVPEALKVSVAEDMTIAGVVDQHRNFIEALKVSVANSWEATRPGGQTAATSSIPSPPNYTPVFDKNKNFIPVVCHCELCKLAHFESVARSSLKAAKAKAAAAWDIARGLDEGDH
jgi:hypothetical protein